MGVTAWPPSNVEIAADALLKKWIEFGIDYRIATNPAFRDRWMLMEDAYIERVQHEFTIIADKQFCDYFLVTSDIVRWAKDVDKQGVGPGRGSAAGSLLCYLLRITEIDPMQFPLMQFERFIDPSRPDWPDIDLDFANPEAVFRYGAEKYGAEYTAHIGNFNRYRGRKAVEDVARVYEIGKVTEKAFKNFIVDRPEGDPRENDSVEDAIEAFDEARKIAAKHPELRLAARLEGQLRGLGIHAAGMVISNRPITETCAIYSKKDSKGREVEVISYDKRDAEYLNILKLDILGLTTMQIVQDVVEMVPDLSFEQFYAMPFDDPRVLAGFVENNLTGIFQFEGRTTRSIVERVYKNAKRAKIKGSSFVGPNSGYEGVRFLTLADINALSRPGALISGMTGRYIKVEQGLAEPRDYGYDAVNQVLGETHGCLVYQEQVMAMGRAAGMPGDRVGALRRIIGKKKAGGAFDEFWAEFRDGMAKHQGMPEEDAKELWDFMAAGSSYLFNIAHAVSYAVIAYWAMWVKINHPVEFYAASLRYAEKTKDKDPALALMQDAVKKGIQVLPPDIEASEKTWVRAGNNAIRAGFLQLPDVGESLARQIIEWRAAEHEEREKHGQVNTPWNWSDLQYVKAKTRTVRVPCEPYQEEVTRTRTSTNAEGEKVTRRFKEMVTRDYRREKEVTEPARGVSGLGPKKIAAIVAFAENPDPFGIRKAADAVERVRYAIQDGELPLDWPNADAHDLAFKKDEPVTFIGLVKEVKIIDVVEDQRKRTNQTPEEIRAELRDPHLTTKAKIICVDDIGTDVHVNVHRWLYPEVKTDIDEIAIGSDVLHVVGIAREGFGPTVQAQAIVPIGV
ncbi:DnaE-like DNA polymerase III alpha [Rhodococcus phage MacGully]|nr:DnaE-like DNA polymerase III alpha [Rhodococcus phage MacGully]